MARWLKTGISAEDKAAADTRVRGTVEGLLADIAARGDAAVREMSARFDKWDRADYRLTDAEIRECLGQVQDLMGPVVFLASDASALMTGSAMLIDGGWTAE